MLEENYQKMSIGELAKESGLATSAIRYYETRGLLQSTRTEGGQRQYDRNAALALRQVRFAQSAGFTLSEIVDLLGPMNSGEPLFGQWRALAERKMSELDAVIEQAHEMKLKLHQALSCQCAEPDDCGLLRS
jgi:MerR family transcriptional regulator, redox-sensitive transcriptional activator SoxR